MFAVHRTKAVIKQVVIVVARKHRKAQKMSASGGEILFDTAHFM